MSSSTKNASAMSTPTNNTHIKKGLTRYIALPRRASSPNNCPNRENTGRPFKTEPGGSCRSSRRSEHRTPTASPSRASISPRLSDIPSTSRRTSPRRSSESSSRKRRPWPSGEGILDTFPRGSRLLNGDNLLEKLSRSLVNDPLKPSSPGPSMQNKGDTAVDSSSSGAITHRLVSKDTKIPCSARGKPTRPGPSAIAPLDRADGLSTYADEAELRSEGESIFNSIIILSDELELEIPPVNPDFASCSSSKGEDEPPSRKRSKRVREDDSEAEEATFRAKAYKQRKLNTTKTGSPRDITDTGHVGSNIGCEVLYSFGFETLIDSEPLLDNLVVNDPSSSRLVGSDRIQTNLSILPSWIAGIECESAEFAAAELTAGDYFLDAFIALIKYTRIMDDAGNSLELRQEARREMAEAWGMWRTVSIARVDMSVLRHYGSSLDVEGKRALAAALKVQSIQLESWFDEPRRVVDSTLEVGELLPESPSQHAEHPIYTHGPPSLFLAPVSNSSSTDQVPPPVGIDHSPTPSSTPATIVGSSSAPAPRRNRNRNRVLAQLPTIPSSSVATPSQPITFGKTPEARMVAKKGQPSGQTSGDLPRWTKGFDYCDSYDDLVQWKQERHAHLARSVTPPSLPYQGMTTEEEQQVVHELTDGKGLAHVFAHEESRALERRACAVLPSDQLPLLLDGEVAARAYKGTGKAPAYVLYCRANFNIDWEKGIRYRDRVCGTTFRTNENAIRHLREQHLTVNRLKISNSNRRAEKRTTMSSDSDDDV